MLRVGAKLSKDTFYIYLIILKCFNYKILWKMIDQFLQENWFKLLVDILDW